MILGDIATGKQIGKTGLTYIYLACPECGYARWVDCNYLNHRNPPMPGRCHKCCHKDSRKPNNQGRRPNSDGYIQVWIYPENPYFSTGNGGGRKGVKRIKLHRLVMAQHLRRNLTSEEIVHHINRNTLDNRIENLMLLTLAEHEALPRHKRNKSAK